jgi:hypothetical protein
MSNRKEQKMIFEVTAHNDHTGVFEKLGTIEAKTPRGANQIAWKKWGYDKFSQFTFFAEDNKVYDFAQNFNRY